MHLRALQVLGLVLLIPATSFSYPGGTPGFITDVAPYCAGCHASVSEAQLTGLPAARVQSQLPAAKHLAKIQQAAEGSPYAALTDQQRDELIQGITALDAASSVELLAPAQLTPGAVFEVTVRAVGGGPVAGLALVDAVSRFQARPAPSAGWQVVDKPRVVGPDGQDQTDFTDRRDPALAPGLAYVNVYGAAAKPGQAPSKVSARFRLRAPQQAGSYPLAAAFLYGTEKSSPHGAVETISGTVPLGGYGGNSGRIRFSNLIRIEVGAAPAGASE